MAHDGKELLDHLNWDKYHLVGLCTCTFFEVQNAAPLPLNFIYLAMGGMIAQELALLAPERLKSLCLCVTHSGGLHALPPVSGLWIMSQTVFSDMKTEAELLMKLQFSERFLSAKAANQGPETNKTNRDVLIEDFYLKRKKEGAPSMRGLIGQISAVSRHYISRERLRYLKQKLTEQNAPILLMTGTKDNLVKPINSFILKEILDVKLLVFEGAGHMIHIECESAFNQIVHRHISSPTTTVSSL
jgi:pimeloyl-ACP methyl ester carboxylesterase